MIVLLLRDLDHRVATMIWLAGPGLICCPEAEVLSLIALGLSNREIAEALIVSEATVKTHINHVFAKIRARDRAQAVHYAYAHGLTPLT